jgi:RNA polymerase sigma-70 factor (ECF subfamily)
MTPASDGELLQAFRAGDPTAFAALVDRHQGVLLRHARAILGVGPDGEAVVQEVFLKLAQSPPLLPSSTDGDSEAQSAHLCAWLHTVNRNACMDTQRSTRRRSHREEQAASPEAHDGGIAHVEQADTRAAVERELERLPVDQREVLVLRLLADRSYKEIAEITGRSIGTVGWLVSEGLQQLGERLRPQLEGRKVGGRA